MGDKVLDMGELLEMSGGDHSPTKYHYNESFRVDHYSRLQAIGVSNPLKPAFFEGKANE